MRIVAGEFRSRMIKAVEGDATRPTSDKIKEAIFSRIGPYFAGGRMLDLFGGSGNMGLEALSRGMDEVYFCDMNYKAIKTIKANAASLGVEKRCHIIKGDYQMMLQKMVQEHQTFDFIYIDPPYRKQQIHKILSFIADHELLNLDGDLVCESLCEDQFDDAYGAVKKVKEAFYGITRITYYTR